MAVGSTRLPKVQAVRRALEAFGGALDAGAQFDVLGVDMASGVGHTPLGPPRVDGWRAGASRVLSSRWRMAAAKTGATLSDWRLVLKLPSRMAAAGPFWRVGRL